ncbi:MAG: helix-turn-helix domain-containing protein [Bacteroidales bacterium]|nr:helix-turn-helix domain-containing protein [Bacteroidales bacterium]
MILYERNKTSFFGGDHAMICVSREIGANIAIYRKRARITQQQLADALTDVTGDSISMHMVSAWERGKRDIPVSVFPALCRIIHCTSYELYPHVSQVTDRSAQLIATIDAMSDDEKNDLFYLLCQWHGDRKAMLKLDVLHAVQSPAMRREPVKITLRNYMESCKSNDPALDRRAHVDYAYVKKAFDSLLDDDWSDDQCPGSI